MATGLMRDLSANSVAFPWVNGSRVNADGQLSACSRCERCTKRMCGVLGRSTCSADIYPPVALFILPSPHPLCASGHGLTFWWQIRKLYSP